jgi:hypothetical protein
VAVADSPTSAQGSLWAIVLYDVSEQIQLESLRSILGAPPAAREPRFKNAPEYVRFETPPLEQTVDPPRLASGEHLLARLKYFDYGVIAVELELPFQTGWKDLIERSSRWIGSAEVEKLAGALARQHAERARAAFVEPFAEWVSEDYYLIHICAGPLGAQALLAECGSDIVQLLRGETRRLSAGEIEDALRASLSYYPSDLLVVGWAAALIYDTAEGAAPTIQLLEYANAQLLEFRYYDNLLTKVLGGVYRSLGRRGFLRSWRMAREAGRLNQIRLDITELTERVDNSIKFLGDMFYTRAYRMAAARIGVNDYRKLVDEKLRTAGELYEFMVDEFHQARAFVLELMVVAILIIELVRVFWRP